MMPFNVQMLVVATVLVTVLGCGSNKESAQLVDEPMPEVNGAPVEWHRGFGTDGGDHIHEIMQTTDGGYLGIGEASTDDDFADLLVVKIDTKGELMWLKVVGSEGAFDIGIAISESEDGYLIGGGKTTGGNQQRYVAKLNFEGDFIWENTYDNTGAGMIRGIEVLDNGEIVVTGYKGGSEEGYVFIADNTEGFIMKLAGNGDVIWEKGISAAQGAKVKEDPQSDGFIICTTTWMNDPDHPQDMYLMKFDRSGNELWSKNYGAESDEHCYDCDVTSDGGYVLGGHTRSPSYGVVNWDYLMIKLDQNGEEEWARTFGQPRGYDPEFIHDEAYGVRQTPDGGFVIAGGTGDEYSYSASGSKYGPSDNWRAYVVKVNAEGQMVWEGVYGSTAGDNAAEHLGLTDDGGLIIGTDSDTAGSGEYGSNNFGFLKLAPHLE